MEVAREQGVTIVALSDSPAVAHPARCADHGFRGAVDTPQFFPSSVSTIALLETLLFRHRRRVATRSSTRVERFHKRRHQLGIYHGGSA